MLINDQLASNSVSHFLNLFHFFQQRFFPLLLLSAPDRIGFLFRHRFVQAVNDSRSYNRRKV
jgi:hypothetical protein